MTTDTHLQAVAEFTSDEDDVTIIIGTFRAPPDELEELKEAVQKRIASFLELDNGPGELYYFIAPSEGFGYHVNETRTIE